MCGRHCSKHFYNFTSNNPNKKTILVILVIIPIWEIEIQIYYLIFILSSI